jgi:hypothetical protein
MGTVDNRDELDTTIQPDGMQKNYLVLSVIADRHHV